MILPYGLIARRSRAEVRGFRVPRIEHADGLGSVSPPAGVVGRVCPTWGGSIPARIPLVQALSVSFRLLTITMVATIHLR